MKYRLFPLLVLLIVLCLAALSARAQQLNPGGGILVPVTGIFDWLLVGPVGTTPPAPGTVNAMQYEVNGTLIGVANMSDYAQGPWTPTIFGGTTPGTPIYSVASGTYEKIGRQVTVRFYLSPANLGGAAGLANIGGLPYPSGAGTNDLGICSFAVYSNVTMTAGYTQLAAMVPNGQSYASMYMSGSGQGPGALQISNLANGAIFVGMCNYHT